MSEQNRLHTFLNAIKHYAQEANKLRSGVQHRVLSFHLYDSTERKNWSLLEKLRKDRLLQRRKTFRNAGGSSSSVAVYAMDKLTKARHK